MRGGLVAPRMPPTEGMTVAALCESRLDAALTTLAAAIGAGWRQHGHMLSDAASVVAFCVGFKSRSFHVPLLNGL